MKKSMLVAMFCSVAIGAAVSVVPAAQAADPETAQLMLVQALPDHTLDIDFDRNTLTQDSETGSVLGPFSLPAGEHHVTFRDSSGEVVLDTAVQLTAGASQDLVVHLPADVKGDPVATLYTTPTSPIGVDKARVLIAHTASVAPADVRLDGAVVFTNIANGEFATADVAKGAHVAELLPSGLTSRPILGPLKVTLPAETATMVYAVGDTKNDSMEVIAHSIPLTAKRAGAPRTIAAGSAGLAAGIRVKTFKAHTAPATAAGNHAHLQLAGFGGALVGLLVLALTMALRSRRRLAGEAPL